MIKSLTLLASVIVFDDMCVWLFFQVLRLLEGDNDHFNNLAEQFVPHFSKWKGWESITEFNAWWHWHYIISTSTTVCVYLNILQILFQLFCSNFTGKETMGRTSGFIFLSRCSKYRRTQSNIFLVLPLYLKRSFKVKIANSMLWKLLLYILSES